MQMVRIVLRPESPALDTIHDPLSHFRGSLSRGAISRRAWPETPSTKNRGTPRGATHDGFELRVQLLQLRVLVREECPGPREAPPLHINEHSYITMEILPRWSDTPPSPEPAEKLKARAASSKRNDLPTVARRPPACTRLASSSRPALACAPKSGPVS